MATNFRTSFNEALTPIYPALYRLAVETVGGDLAADGLQNGLITAWERTQEAAWMALHGGRDFDRFRAPRGTDGNGEGSDFFLFLVPFLKSACHDLLRNRRVRSRFALPLTTVLELAEQGAPPELEGELWEQRRLELWRLMERVRLTPLQENCIRAWSDGCSQLSIAEYWGIRQSAVSRHIAAGCSKLRGAYEAQEANAVEDAATVAAVFAKKFRAYHKPSQSWDRAGTAEQRERRRWQRN